LLSFHVFASYVHVIDWIRHHVVVQRH
jgi:hypothetical protein